MVLPVSDSAPRPTFLFHDYETFGTSPSLDRPAQFGAIRTDADFNVIGEPEVFYCRPADDYLPQPGAVMVTGITPQEAREKGVIEAEFARRIHDLFTVPETCVVGYNNVRFDDEVTRNIFYRNFYDPYAWSWQNGNSRWDLLDVMRACYALRPEGINWPENDDGLPSFRLEHLTRANDIEHGNAHDAMADVYATIAMAKKVKAAQPRLFDYLLSHRSKQKLMTLIDVPQMKPLVHVSGMFGALRGNTSWVAPLAWHPDNRNAVIMVDLAGDITPLLELESAELRERLYTAKASLGDRAAVPLKLVHINKCPVLAQANTLRPEDAERLGIDRQQCLENLKILRENPQVREKAVALFAEAEPFVPQDNVDTQLYNGFFSDADRAAMKIVLQTDPRNLPALDITFVDPRIEKLLFNYRARNYPGTLDEAEQARWLEHRRALFTPAFLEAYVGELESLFVEHQGDSEKQAQLKALWQYMQEIV
ncbi:exodeoxyribonuclease I [Enterobacter hormaechei]|uniref:exodeoxyribonuclease I n=1 Tax=Enterobacter cloacae complex TaxID=354276 RepID=UPI0018889C76|nr:exodeoxyribonuclease I [Enterobacter hormaechei]EKZ9487270.1 exodeoxyribonuclease I [Enterobacter hormaechei]MBF1949305.1 exodeoxyribonuclease I [Enterobacter hormaechei]MCE1404222.1 exodeoxyribonuclease I [Enterobacter hormaechei]MCM7058121.1 exodeoxyribonuclease I [Enterobacter hormaechei]MCV2339816.1 exodeoxyribonuclease I [Enterobacter hormaechei]